MITGGSSGLGKAIALQLLKKGANVTIIARNKAQLEIAEIELNKHKVFPEQEINSISVDVTDYTNMETSIDNIEKTIAPIEVIFCCAGTSCMDWAIFLLFRIQ